MKDNYRVMSHIYNILAAVYSNGSIQQCREAMIEKIQPGDAVLFAGVGHGAEAMKAIAAGHAVTVVELSSGMLNQFEANLKKINEHTVRIIHDDILNVTEYARYDFVFANFFLNVFPEDKMPYLLDHLVKLVKPGGSVVIGDWSYPQGNVAKQTFQKAYWYIGLLPFYLTTNNAFHPIYNYVERLEKAGMTVTEIKHFTYLKINCYWSILAKKTS